MEYLKNQTVLNSYEFNTDVNMASKPFNISLPEKWSDLIAEISKLTGESMASIIQRATIAYLENAIAIGLIDKLRSGKKVSEIESKLD